MRESIAPDRNPLRQVLRNVDAGLAAGEDEDGGGERGKNAEEAPIERVRPTLAAPPQRDPRGNS